MGILDEVIDCLVHVTLLILSLEADTDKLVVGDVENCREHVNVEAVHLDVKPSHDGAFGRCECAAFRIALDLLVVDSHLNVEDGTLVHEDRDRVTNATKQLPDAVPVTNAHVLNFALLSRRLIA